MDSFYHTSNKLTSQLVKTFGCLDVKHAGKKPASLRAGLAAARSSESTNISSQWPEGLSRSSRFLILTTYNIFAAASLGILHRLLHFTTHILQQQEIISQRPEIIPQRQNKWGSQRPLVFFSMYDVKTRNRLPSKLKIPVETNDQTIRWLNCPIIFAPWQSPVYRFRDPESTVFFKRSKWGNFLNLKSYQAKSGENI